ncbi:hypothetical protein [Streptomyces sp. NPDC056169]|uniref:hypothetical protein n=1 Tax=Streptomyces sp. NPDC056169 TaxID=3345734 RepID=UPI0035D5D657
MIDNLGFHTDRDFHTELATLQSEITILTAQVGHSHSWEARHNALAQLDHLRGRADVIAREAAAADANQERLAAAVRLVGDIDLGFIAYVVFGPAALPMQPRYEVRLIERRGGYTVPGTVRRDLTEEQIVEAQREVLAETLKPGGHARLWNQTAHDFRTQVTAY